MPATDPRRGQRHPPRFQFDKAQARPRYDHAHGIGLLGACTVAVPAYAQSSSLAIFGHIDVNVTAASAGGSSKVGLDQGGYMLLSRRLAAPWSLGNGNSVGFWLEAPILPNSGGPQGLTWSRRSTISLANRLGRLRLGGLRPRSQMCPRFRLSARWAWAAAATSSGWPLGLGDTLLSRASNMLAYFLPKKLGGVYGQLNYAREEDMDGADYAGGRLGYQSGPLNVAAAYGRTSTERQALRATVGDASFALRSYSPTTCCRRSARTASTSRSRARPYRWARAI